MNSVKHICWNTNFHKIVLRVSDICNFNCFYCFTKNKSNNFLIEDNIIHIIKYIEYIQTKFSHISVHISGPGEPFLYPYILKLIYKILSVLRSNDLLHICTNLSKNIEKLPKSNNLYLEVSYHYTTNHHLFMQNISILQRNNINFYVVILARPNILDSIKLQRMLTKNSIDCEIKPIFNVGRQYTKFEKQIISNNSLEDIIQYNNNYYTRYAIYFSSHYNFKNWICLAGYNYSIIDYDLNIYACNKFISIGKLPELPVLHPIICTQSECSVCDIGIPKYKKERTCLVQK